MEYLQRTLKGASFVFVMLIITAFIGYVVRLVMARNLALEDYGLFYAIFSLFGFIAIFREMGLSQALAKFIPELQYKKKLGYIKGLVTFVFLVQFLISLAITIFFILFSPKIAVTYFHTIKASVIIQILAVMFLLIPFENIFKFSFQGFQKSTYFSLVDFLRMLIILVLTVVLFRFNLDLLAPSISYLAVYAITPLIYIFLFLKMFPSFLNVKMILNKSFVKKIVDFSLPMTVGLFGSIILLYTDTLILTYFRSLKEVALYNAAAPTAKLLLYFSSAICVLLLPLSSELWSRNLKKELAASFEKLLKYNLIVIIPVGLAMFAFSRFILTFLFGKTYGDAYIVLQLISLGTIAYSLSFLNNNVLIGIGKPKTNTYIILFAAGFNLIANIIVVPFFGMYGVAITTVMSYLMIFLLTTIKVQKYLGNKIMVCEYGKSILGGCLFVGVIYILKLFLVESLVNVLLMCAVAFVIYLLFIFYSGYLNKGDIIFIKTYFKKPEKAVKG